MGHCISIHLYVSSADDEPSRSVDSTSAKVISINGDLREYALPVTASLVLDSEICSSSGSSSSGSSSSGSSSSGCFLCNSDRLRYDEFIPAIATSDFLSPDHIYFVLPRSKLHNRLAASDMAALAVKASIALRDASEGGTSRRRRRRRSRNKTKISPVLLVSNNGGGYYYQSSSDEEGYNPSMTVKRFDSKAPANSVISRSGSARKMQRLSSRRMKLAVRSFRMRLSTIYEGTVL